MLKIIVRILNKDKKLSANYSTGCTAMVLILDGNLEHVAHDW